MKTAKAIQWLRSMRDAWKRTTKSAVLTQAAAYKIAAKAMGLKEKDVKAAVEGLLGFTANQLKTNGSTELAGMLKLKLKLKPATPARKGVHPFTRKPIIFKAKAASKTVRVLPMKKLNDIMNETI